MKNIYYNSIIFLIILFFFLSCAKHSNDDLQGNWEAAIVLEEGLPLEIDYSQIKFSFTENGFYEFNSTLDYKEAGEFKINKELLFTKDSINKKAVEKAVRISKLTSDSLFLEMKDDGKKRIIQLFKL